VFPFDERARSCDHRHCRQPARHGTILAVIDAITTKAKLRLITGGAS